MIIKIDFLDRYLCTSQIEASTFPPPPPPHRAFDSFSCPGGGNLIILVFPGAGHLIITHRGWGIWSLASISCYLSTWVDKSFALVTGRPYCPGRAKKLLFYHAKPHPMVSTVRLGVGNYGRRVTRANGGDKLRCIQR